LDRKIRKKKLTAKRITWILLAGGFLAFCFYKFVLGDDSTKLNVKSERIIISTVHEGPFPEYIPFIGSVIPKKTIYHDNRFRKHQIKQIEASLKRMDANLKIAKQQLADHTLKAPAMGHLTSLNAEIGESKKQEERLGQIDILDGFKVRVPVDEHYLARINTGQHGEFIFDDKTYQLTISKIYPEVFEVLSGLQAGERVITSSYDNYGDNIDKLALK